MNRAPRALVVEDLPRWQAAITESLEEAGFEVVVAASRLESARLLESQIFHLVMLDLRLDEADQSNLEGMDFLRELAPYGISEALRVVILTAYPTTERIREAFALHHVADFLTKNEFDPDQLTQLASTLVKKNLGANFDLEILWQGALSPEQAVLNLRIGYERVKRESPWQRLLAQELTDLLSRLFSNAESLIMEPMSQGHSGAGVLRAKPFYPGRGGARAVVVKFGDHRDIEREHENFKKYVEGWVGGGRSTAVYEQRRGLRLGGIAYSFLGGEDGHVEDFASYYRKSEIDGIRRALDSLFSDTCGSWYANPGHQRPIDLSSQYLGVFEMRPEPLEKAIQELKAVEAKGSLRFRSLSGSVEFTDPLPLIATKPLIRSSYETTTHGDLNPHNILVDEEGRTWLIDFLRTGSGHYLRDAVMLDTSIRIELLAEGEATLDERLELEQALSGASTFSQVKDLGLPGRALSPAVEKAFLACCHLRQLAAQLVAVHSGGDFSEFNIGTLFCALNLMRFRSLAKVQREHALLSASVLAGSICHG